MLTCINAFRSVAAFLFPIFASYKALKANDQTQLTPWLMYWVVVACVIVVENFLGWFLNLYGHIKLRANGRIPMYQDIKAVFLLWLVLPQTQVLRVDVDGDSLQGATYLYLTYIHPYIQAHESDIENIISSGHDQFKRIGITYLRRFWAYLQQTLGLPTQVALTLYVLTLPGPRTSFDTSSTATKSSSHIHATASSKVLPPAHRTI